MKLIGYARISKKNEHGVSLEAQESKIRAQCVVDEAELVGQLEVDDGASGKSIKRPALQRALERLERGEADGLIVAKLDRLTRSVYDLGPLLARSQARPAKLGGPWQLLSVSEKFDTATPSGRFIMNMLAAMAQWERETIAARTKDALAHLKTKGVKIGRAGLGTKVLEKRDAHGRRVRTVDHEENRLVARIIALRQPEARMSYEAIADMLNEEGVPTKQGGRWGAQTILNIVKRHPC